MVLANTSPAETMDGFTEHDLNRIDNEFPYSPDLPILTRSIRELKDRLADREAAEEKLLGLSNSLRHFADSSRERVEALTTQRAAKFNADINLQDALDVARVESYECMEQYRRRVKVARGGFKDFEAPEGFEVNILIDPTSHQTEAEENVARLVVAVIQCTEELESLRIEIRDAKGDFETADQGRSMEMDRLLDAGEDVAFARNTLNEEIEKLRQVLDEEMASSRLSKLDIQTLRHIGDDNFQDDQQAIPKSDEKDLEIANLKALQGNFNKELGGYKKELAKAQEETASLKTKVLKMAADHQESTKKASADYQSKLEAMAHNLRAISRRKHEQLRPLTHQDPKAKDPGNKAVHYGTVITDALTCEALSRDTREDSSWFEVFYGLGLDWSWVLLNQGNATFVQILNWHFNFKTFHNSSAGSLKFASVKFHELFKEFNSMLDSYRRDKLVMPVLARMGARMQQVCRDMRTQYELAFAHHKRWLELRNSTFSN